MLIPTLSVTINDPDILDDPVISTLLATKLRLFQVLFDVPKYIVLVLSD